MPKENDGRLDDDLDGDEDSVELSNDMARAQDNDPDDDDDDGYDGGVDGDADDDDDDDDDDVDSRRQQPGEKSKRTAKDRIAELAKLRREAEKAAFGLEMRNIELERQLAERGSAKTEAPKEPSAKDFTYGEVDPAYLSAVVDYKVALREADILREAAKSAGREAETKANERYGRRLAEVMAAGKKRFKDFEDVVASTTYEPHLARMILDSENAVDIAYFLSNNVGDLRALTRADAAERARIIGRMEGRFSATSAAKKKTKAPEVLGSRQSRENRRQDGRYGPDTQDDFDKAFFRR